MIARNRIWEEMKQAKANILCLQKYTDKKRGRLRYYNMSIALLASGGALGSVINMWIPTVTSFIVAFGSIIKSVMPNFLQTEPELLELDGLSDFYSEYLNHLEKIWYDSDNDIIDEQKAMSQFFELKESECDKASILNRGVTNISKKMQNRINEEAGEYINRVYFTKTE